MKAQSPALRFPEFSAPWRGKPFSALLERVSTPVEVVPEKLYRQIGVRSHGRGVFHKEAVTGADLGNKRVFHVVPNALVLNIVFAWEHAVAMTSDDDAGYIASHRFPMFGEKDKSSYLPFIRQMLLTPRGKQLLEIASPGGAGRNKTLGQDAFLKLKPAVPERDEQKKIASFLDAVSEKITLLTRKKSALEDYKRGLMQRLFSQSLRFTQNDGSAFPDWEEVPLGELLEYEQPTKYLVATTDYAEQFQVPVLTAGKTFILGYTDESHGVFEEGLPVIIFDDFTTAMKFVDFPFKAKSSAMKILRAKSTDVNIRLAYELMSAISYEPGDHKRHWISEFQYFSVMWPHPDEQAKIAEALSALDAKISATSDQITQMETFKKGLLQKMFV